MEHTGNQPNIWFTSDTHYNHKNIVLGETTWDDKSECRKFDTVEQMNATLIKNFNSVIKPQDILYHMGDVAFGANKEKTAIEFFNSLNCMTIYWIRGNHDPKIYKIDCGKVLWIKDIAEVRIENRRVVLCHYAMRVWNESHRGAFCLYGHSHGSLPDDPNALSMDVGVDTNFLMPYSWEEIKYYMGKKDYKPIDHHTSKTT